MVLLHDLPTTYKYINQGEENPAGGAHGKDDGGDALEEVLRNVLIAAIEGGDEGDVCVWGASADVYAWVSESVGVAGGCIWLTFEAARHLGGWIWRRWSLKRALR